MVFVFLCLDDVFNLICHSGYNTLEEPAVPLMVKKSFVRHNQFKETICGSSAAVSQAVVCK